VDGGEIFVAFRTAVADKEGIARYDSDLTPLNTLGPFDNVSFREIAIDPAGRVDVADYRNSVVRRFNRTGGEIDRIGKRGLGVGEMNGPDGLATDCRGSVYVLDAAARFDSGDVHRAGSKVLKFEAGAEPPPCANRELPKGAIDTQVNDVEVTQATQPPLSYTADSDASRVRTRAYGSSTSGSSGEVRMKALLPTVVRVYANLHDGPAGGIANVPATLEAVTSDGERLGPIQPVGRPALLRVGDRTVEGSQRTNPVAAYSFQLPEEWTVRGSIDLIARVNPAGLGCDQQCLNRSTFRLTGVPFGRIRIAPISPIALTDDGKPPIKDPRRAFEIAQRVTPLSLQVRGYQTEAEVGDLLRAGSVTVTECFIGIWPCSTHTYAPPDPKYRQYVQGLLMDRLEDAADERGINGCYEVPMGLVSGVNPNLPGATQGEFLAKGLNPCALSYATVTRPVAIAHELQHAFSRPHAGQDCPGTGPGEDQEGEPWPPDNRGLLGGIGLNTMLRGSGSRGPFEIIAPGVGGRPAEMFDLMSYCSRGNDFARWISPRGWNNLSGWRVEAPETRMGGSVSNRAKGSERLLQVTAIEANDGTLGITGVSPTTVASPPGDPNSPYVLQALGAKHAVLTSRRVDAEGLTESHGRIISGTVPAPPGTRQVFLRHGNQIGTVWNASPNPPSVDLIRPRASTRASRSSLVVRWQASSRRRTAGGHHRVLRQRRQDLDRRLCGARVRSGIDPALDAHWLEARPSSGAPG
jgi:hypothetical protein